MIFASEQYLRLRLERKESSYYNTIFACVNEVYQHLLSASMLKKSKFFKKGHKTFQTIFQLKNGNLCSKNDMF